VKQIPRQADCIARGAVRLLSMSRDTFERLMGPVEQVLAAKIEEYHHVNR
jgi:hypothetical protein